MGWPTSIDVVANAWAKASEYNALRDDVLNAVGRLTVAIFQLIAAAGTFTVTPEQINDGDTGTLARADNVNEYAEITLPSALRITQFRQFGNVNNDGDGRWKIQYMDGEGNWHDWVTGIAARTTADWSGWDSSGGEVLAIAIKIICTTLDTQSNESFINELEVKY